MAGEATSGGTTQFWLNSVEVARAVNCTASQQNQLIRVDTLGRLFSSEILVDNTSCSLQASAVYVAEEDWNLFGITYRLDAAGQITVVSLPEAAEAQIFNVKGDKVIARLIGLKLESLNVTTQKGMAVMSNITMQGTVMLLGEAQS